MAALIDLAKINFAGRGSGDPGERLPDYNADYSQDYRAALPEDNNA